MPVEVCDGRNCTHSEQKWPIRDLLASGQVELLPGEFGDRLVPEIISGEPKHSREGREQTETEKCKSSSVIRLAGRATDNLKG